MQVSEEVRVTRMWAAVDVGQAINPDGVINQIEGGIIQTVSWTLKEREIPWLPRTIFDGELNSTAIAVAARERLIRGLPELAATCWPVLEQPQ